MKRVLVFRFSGTEGPGHFATFLEANGIDWELVALDEGASVPASAEGLAGLGFMGGSMSANDELPWTRPVLALMRDAVSRRVPVIGHCLGGQMFARALGAAVTRNLVKEIGWVPVRAEAGDAARAWLGELSAFTAFQWHEDAFALPRDAVRILTGEHCANQAYVVEDRHLGMQCHVEMTPELIETWCRTGAAEIEAASTSPAVQDAATIRSLIRPNLAPLSAVADRLYTRWIEGLGR